MALQLQYGTLSPRQAYAVAGELGEFSAALPEEQRLPFQRLERLFRDFLADELSAKDPLGVRDFYAPQSLPTAVYALYRGQLILARPQGAGLTVTVLDEEGREIPRSTLGDRLPEPQLLERAYRAPRPLARLLHVLLYSAPAGEPQDETIRRVLQFQEGSLDSEELALQQQQLRNYVERLQSNLGDTLGALHAAAPYMEVWQLFNKANPGVPQRDLSARDGRPLTPESFERMVIHLGLHPLNLSEASDIYPVGLCEAERAPVGAFEETLSELPTLDHLWAKAEEAATVEEMTPVEEAAHPQAESEGGYFSATDASGDSSDEGELPESSTGRAATRPLCSAFQRPGEKEGKSRARRALGRGTLAQHRNC